MRVRECWKAAGWAVCCVSSGCPCGRTSFGSAQPAAAAGSTPVGSGSAEHPPVRGQENSKSGSRSSVEDSAPSSGDKTAILTFYGWLSGNRWDFFYPVDTFTHGGLPTLIRNHVKKIHKHIIAKLTSKK